MQIGYNGVFLPYPLSTSFEQTAVGDDVSDTDLCYTKFDLSVQAVVHSNYIPLLAPDLANSGAQPADIMDAVRSRLEQRRRTLSVRVNGVELIPATTTVPGTVDDRNGPVPQTVRVLQLTETSFLIVFRVIAHYFENNTVDGTASPIVQNNKASSPIIYNRWSESVTIDDLLMTTRVREGKFSIRSNNIQGKTADQFRSQFAVVGVPPGFLRQSADYTVTPDGLALQYRIVDKEVYKLPPAVSQTSAYRADGEYHETTTNNGAMRWGEVRVRLWGSKTTDQAKLIEIAIGIASAKLIVVGAKTGFTKGGKSKFTLLASSSITVKLYENDIEVRMRVFAKPATTDDGKGRKHATWGLRLSALAFTPISQNTKIPPPYLDQGTYGLLLKSAAYYDPSLAANKLIQNVGQMNAGLEVGQAGATKEP